VVFIVGVNMKKVLVLAIIGFGLSACCGCGGPACDPANKSLQALETQK
jgi:hypothetical protein